MTRLSAIDEWLEDRFTRNQNGIIIDGEDNTSFHAIHDFLETKERTFETPAIYYSAFADDNPAEFISILVEELSSKLGWYKSKCSTLSEIVAMSELQMVIIDRCYLHSLKTTEKLLTWLNQHGVCLILVGSQAEMNRALFLQRSSIADLPKLALDTHQYDLPISC